jgi:hypothetical protein
MKKIIALAILILAISSVSAYELNMLVDSPTAGILQKGEASIIAKLYKDNGLILGTKVGLFPGFMFGVSYGAEQVVGNLEPNWHERVEFNAKFRIIDEATNMPAIALGYDSQGHGQYNSSNKRYDIKSKGFYAVASKNYLFLGNVGFHFGANFSLEVKDKDDQLNFFCGLDKDLGKVITFLWEYDFAWNDNSNQTIEEALEVAKHGYMNTSFDINFTEYLKLKVSFYDMLKKRSDTFGSDRTLALIYNMTF